MLRQDTLVENYIGKLGLLSEYMLWVRTEIQRHLHAGQVSVEQVAEDLNITVRTLQRRLSAEQSSYHQLLDEVRHQLALDYMQSPSARATEIAFKLGFNDSGSFGRSFKRWTGYSFTEYREQK
jgi:AraC-like DNA-binding protein